MPRYFFHEHNDVARFVQEGVEFASWREAQVAAIRTAGAIISENAVNFGPSDEWTM